MAIEDARAQTLRRIRRLREIEAMEIKTQLAAAQDQETRMRALHARTQNMAHEYSHSTQAVTGAELRQSAGLSSALTQLGAQTTDHIRAAQQDGERAAAELARLDHQKERLSERIAELDHAAQTRRDARAAESANGVMRQTGGSLARSLLDNEPE